MYIVKEARWHISHSGCKLRFGSTSTKMQAVLLHLFVCHHSIWSPNGGVIVPRIPSVEYETGDGNVTGCLINRYLMG